MPELSEVKIMSHFINSVSQGKKFNNIRKSESTKQVSVDGNPFSSDFKIMSVSRGKELMIRMKSDSSNKRIIFSMGMSGNWKFVKKGYEPKHAHLMFDTSDGYTLCLVDVRRFAKWKYCEDWSYGKRGPCPLTEFTIFKINILEQIAMGPEKIKKIFHKPIYELMMDQRYFNGVGNYLRAEILYRIKSELKDNNLTCFNTGYEVLKNLDLLNLFLSTVKDVINESFILGGGELNSWENPYSKNRNKTNNYPKTFREWLKCYQKGNSLIDSKGRKFWY